MENLLDIINILNKSTNQENSSPQNTIPKEILDQYPYGQFPSRYTKSGQEDIRKNSENRFSHIEQNQNPEPKENNNLDIANILPIIQLMSGKQNSKDMMKVLSKMLFKENKDLEKIFDLLTPKNKAQEIKSNNYFPDTNKVKISTLRRIDE